MKEAYFFSHDYNARQDPKMQEVLMDYGVAGIGIYWCIVEQLYEQGGRMALASIKAIAFALHVVQDDVRSIVMNYGLFDNDGTEFWSPSASRRLDERREIIEKRAKAATKRWSKNAKETDTDANAPKNDANAMQMQKKNDAMQCYIKESKVKEIKEKESNNNYLCIAQSATEEERERFLEIFTFELNFQEPQQEVERFVAHYDASGWCRKDSTIPVKNKEALARMWKPKNEGARYHEEVRQWLCETYQLAGNDQKATLALLRGITRIDYEKQGAGATLTIVCTKPAMQAIEQYHATRAGWVASYRIPN